MSYQGEEEYLCENGHYCRFNCYDAASVMPFSRCECGAKFILFHSIDLTNGYDDSDKSFATCEAPLKVIGKDEIGIVYAPIGKKIWQKCVYEPLPWEDYYGKIKPMRIWLKNSLISYEVKDNKVIDIYHNNINIRNVTKPVLLEIIPELVSTLREVMDAKVKAEKKEEKLEEKTQNSYSFFAEVKKLFK